MRDFDNVARAYARLQLISTKVCWGSNWLQNWTTLSRTARDGATILNCWAIDRSCSQSRPPILTHCIFLINAIRTIDPCYMRHAFNSFLQAYCRNDASVKRINGLRYMRGLLEGDDGADRTVALGDGGFCLAFFLSSSATDRTMTFSRS